MNSDNPSRSLQALEFPEVLAYLSGFAVSEAGHEACLALRPFSSLESVREEAALYEEGRLWLMRHGPLLVFFPSVHAVWEGETLPLYEPDLLWALRQTLQLSFELRNTFLEESAPWPLWRERCDGSSFPVSTLSALTRCLTEDGRFKDSASPELSLVRSELRALHRQCANRVKDFASEYNIMHFLQDDFMTLSSDRYVLPLKANFKGRLQGVVHEYSQTGETCYFEPMFLVEVNNRLQALKREEREEERKILLYLTGLARDEMPAIKAAYAFLVSLDMLRARAALADCYDGRLVELGEEERVHLREAAHPLLALAASEQARKALAVSKRRLDLSEAPVISRAVQEKAVPSTLELKPGQHALVISGGNAGGKTVCLKTMGLIALMSRCALPCPVQPGSSLPFWRHVHAFIGDEQSLEDHVSTFTAQISHLAGIWNGLTSDDLVILDEFGAGTDPAQGAALAQAVIGCITERGAFVIAATHFPALKAYALSTEGVRSASVLFDPKTKKPLFRLVYEQVGASQALDVAREHGLPEEVLVRAGQYLLLNGEDTGALVERLNALAVERETEIAVLAKKQASFEERRRKLDESFEKERVRLFEKVQSDVQKVMTEWKKSRITHKQALKELSAVRGALEKHDLEENKAPALDLTSLALGDSVRHIPWGRSGVLQEIDERKQRVRLNMDGVTLWAKAADLALPEKQPVAGSAAKGGVKVTSSGESFPLQLDLRGKRADVAISELGKFLDNAILQGRYEVEVVHGRGTGALRRELHAFLKDFPAVSQFRLAPENMGGDGMTVVELK